MKVYFLICSVVTLFICDNTAGLRYNTGLYNSAVETICARLLGNYSIKKEEIKQELRFVDTRGTSPILSEEYGQSEKFDKLVSRASHYSELKEFVQACTSIFDNGTPEDKVSVHFLLAGVSERYAKDRDKLSFNDANNHFFDKEKFSSFLKIFCLDKVDM